MHIAPSWSKHLYRYRYINTGIPGLYATPILATAAGGRGGGGGGGTSEDVGESRFRQHTTPLGGPWQQQQRLKTGEEGKLPSHDGFMRQTD